MIASRDSSVKPTNDSASIRLMRARNRTAWGGERRIGAPLPCGDVGTHLGGHDRRVRAFFGGFCMHQPREPAIAPAQMRDLAGEPKRRGAQRRGSQPIRVGQRRVDLSVDSPEGFVSRRIGQGRRTFAGDPARSCLERRFAGWRFAIEAAIVGVAGAQVRARRRCVTGAGGREGRREQARASCACKHRDRSLQPVIPMKPKHDDSARAQQPTFSIGPDTRFITARIAPMSALSSAPDATSVALLGLPGHSG